jgi:hypothetical protein
MKTTILSLLLLFISSIFSIAQDFESDPHRGLYVDKFCTKTSGGNLISALSIIGNQAKEDSLLRFAQKNHFTYLALFDLGQIFGDQVLEDDLCSFMSRAKNEYCITQIGAIVGGDPCNLFDCSSLAPVTFTSPLNSIIPSAIQTLASANLASTDPNYWLSENIKLALKAFMVGGNCQPGLGAPSFDVYSIESEFWGVGNPTQNLAAYNQFLQYLDMLAEIRASFNPSAKIEVYLAAYTNTTVLNKTINQIADDLESTPTPFASKRADRVLMTYYKPYIDSTTSRNASDIYYIYSNSPSIQNPGDATYDRLQSFRRSSTDPMTDWHPLFSAESIYNSGESNFQGAWLNRHRRNTIFMAEKKYYDQWRADPSTQVSSSNENKIVPGGVMWFASSFLADQLLAPIITLPEIKMFTSNSPVATTGTTGTVNFSYIGPIERGIRYEFTILNAQTCQEVVVSGLPASGISGNYIPEVLVPFNHPYSTSIQLPQVVLPVGKYIARLKLIYYHCTVPTYFEEEVLVVNSPTISSLDPLQQCEGNQVTMISSSNGSNPITWYKVGNASPITPIPTFTGKNYELMVTESGFYYSCVGSCSGSGLNGKSNILEVSLTPVEPPIATTTGCNTNLVTFNLPIGASSYIWSNNSTLQSISSSPVSSRRIYKYAYTKNGCFKSGSLSFNSDLFVPPAITNPVLTSSPLTLACAEEVQATADCPTCGNYAVRQYAWSNKVGSDRVVPFYPTKDNEVITLWNKSPNACRTKLTTNVAIPNTVQPNVSSTIINSCGNGNTIDLNAISSFTTTSINWNGPSAFSSSQLDPNPISNADASSTGIYVISASDGSCLAEGALSVSGISIPYLVPIEEINDYCNGAVILNAGCSVPYVNYIWNTSATTSSISVTSSGTYSVTVTDENGCTSSNSISVVVPTVNTPIVSISSNQPSCVSGNLSLNATVTGGVAPYFYDWIGPNGFVDFSNNPNITNLVLNSGGVYEVIVQDANNCITTAQVNVTVTNNPIVSFSGLPTSICSNASPINLSGLPLGGTFSGVGITGTQFDPSGLAPGSYSISYIYSAGSCNGMSSQIITVNAPPAISISGNATVCESSSVVVYTTQSNQSNYQWSVSGEISYSGGTATDNTISIDWGPAGAGLVTVNYTDINSCSISNPVQYPITIQQRPNPVIVGINSVCENQSGEIYSTQAGQLNYSWAVTLGTITNGGTAIDNTVTIDWTSAGIGHVIVNYTDMNGCTASVPADLPITINSPVSPNISVTTNIPIGNGDYYINCDNGTTTQFDISCSNCGTSPTYHIYFHDSNGDHFLFSTQSTIVQVPNADCTSNYYFVTVSSNDLSVCLDNSPSNYIEVTSITVSSGEVILNANPNASTCSSGSDGSIEVSQSFEGSAVSFVSVSWTGPVNGSQNFGSNPVTNYTINNLPPGVYTVSIGNHSQTITLYSAHIDPQPVIFNGYPGLTCGSSLSTVSSYSLYQWYNNGVPSGSPSPNNTFTAVSSGNYSVLVTDQYGCTGTSPIQVVDLAVSSNITGANTTCGGNYFTAFLNDNSTTYDWSIVPSTGFTQNGNSINITWGSSYATGATITCTATNACGISSTSNFIVTTCCALSVSASSTVSCNGGNNASISIFPSNGQTPYSYSWTPNISNSATISNIAPGIYEVLVQDALGCSTSQTITIQPSEQIVLTTQNTYCCYGMSNGSAGVNINSGGIPPFYYSWSNSSTNSLISNLPSALYTVLVTDANGCTSTSSASVSNFPTGLPLPIITGTSSASPGTHTYSLSNYNATYDNYYSWVAIANTGNAVISYPNSNKQTANIQWPSSGGRIEVKFGVVGCQQTVVYYVQPYCTNSYTYFDGSNQLNIISGNTITRANMTINGIFNVTNDFAFKDCGLVSFASGAKIIVASGKTLTIDNCTFGPGTCCKMWKGIELESGAKVIVKNGSTITQAEYGIVVNAGSFYEITDSHFQNNYISLQVGTGGSTSTTGSKIENTDFYSTPFTCGGTMYSNFVPKYEGQITNPGTLPLAGIKADNVTYMKFGSSTPVSGGDLRFNNLNNGVISNNSNLYIQNSRFTNMLPGCGIFAQGGIINLIGLGGDYATSTNTFENCQWGVNASNCDLTVYSVRSHTDVNTAVYFTDCGMVYINNNALGAKYYGVRGYNNPNSNIVIEKNSIHMSTNPVTSACIRIDEFGLDNPVTIDHNDLYLNHSRYGIVTYGMNNALVKENYIQMNNVSNIAGIRSYYSLKNTFQCNTIFALNRYNSYQSGIALSLSPENTINCNWMSNQFEGLGIRGACSPLEIKGNVFNDHAFGLNLTFNGLMGVQTNHGNQWNGNYTYYGAYLSGINSASAQANQVLFYDPNGNGTMPTTTNDIMNLDWFLDNGNPDEFDCYAYDCQPFIPLEANDRIEDEIIAEEDEIGTEYVEPSNYFADRFLFDRLTEDPDLMTNNNILQAFYNQKLYGSIGQFNEMNQEIEEAVKWETVYHIVYATNESMIRTAVDSLNILDSLYEYGYSGPSNHDDLNQTITTLSESNELLRETIEQIKNFRIENAIDDNELIQYGDQYEENESIINNVYLETVASGNYELDADQISQVLTVAIQCPFTGGPSVYRARSLYFLADPEADWDDDAICISNGVQPRMAKVDTRYSLFPNPTTGKVSLKYHIESDEKAMLNVYTTLGVLISSTVLDTDNHQVEVDLSSFKPALYHYKIIVNDQQKRQGMISIIR